MTEALTMMVRGAYALQKLRIQSGLRLCANFREKLKAEMDVEPTEDGELGEKAKKILVELKQRYVRLTDGIARNRTLPAKEGFVGDGVISTYTELALIHQYLQIEAQERQQFRLMGDALEDVPIWTVWLCDQVGIGPAMGGVLVTYFDIVKAELVSQMWALAGLDVGPDGKARGRTKAHLVERSYKAKDGSTKTKMSTTFDPWLQSKLLGTMGPNFLRSDAPARVHYDNYKHRIETDTGRPKGTLADKLRLRKEGRIEEADAIWHKWRIHRASMRYMVKLWLFDFYKAWRELEGLPVSRPYHEAVMGHKHHAA